MRPLTAENEASLRRIAERHGYLARRGPHSGEGSASRLIDALLAGDVVTLALTPAEQGRLVTWLSSLPPPEGGLASILRSVATQLRATLPDTFTAAAPSTRASGSRTRGSPQRGHLTTDEAARRLDLSPGRVQELARAHEIGRKVDGRWVFTTREITRLKAERDRHALRLSLSPKRVTRRRPTSRPRSSSGRISRADVEAMEQLDHLLATERRTEQIYGLPFRAPQRVATTLHTCKRCGQGLLFLIFGDQARDEEALLAYGRLMHDVIDAHGLPAYVLGAPRGDGTLDDTPSLLRQVWPMAGEAQLITPRAWDDLLEQWSQAHCGVPLLGQPLSADQ